ncbi:hypothetical protein BDR06DRAFT_852490, partial [Suillus hirtellus]
DPNDIAEYASSMPIPATAGKPTADELKLMKEWIKEDAQTKAIIGRKLSPIVQNILDEGLSARDQWEMLAKRFARLDVTSQYELRSQLFTERLKDAEDAPRYLGVFENGRRRFAEMRITFTDEEAIFMLLNGLPDTPQWVVFRSLTIGLYNSANVTAPSSSAATTTTSPATTVSFEQMARPGSEYTNAANAASWGPDRKVSNPTTGVRMHKHNPKGVPCDNPACTGLPRSLTHDRAHCLQPGGGMENRAPWAQQKGKSKKDVSASATETKAIENAPAVATTQTAASAVTTESQHRQNLSFAVIEEVDQDYSHLALRSTSTILDSGTTSTLIMDRNAFWTYSQSSSVKVKTANHGYLPTSGRGDCVADLVINGDSYRIRLTDCLHAPG